LLQSNQIKEKTGIAFSLPEKISVEEEEGKCRAGRKA